MRAVAALLLALALAGPAAAASGTGPALGLRAGIFFPSDPVFREVYGNALSFAADLTIPLAGPVHIWAGAGLLSKTGLLTISEETSRLRIVPLFAGLRLQAVRKNVRPYLGVAAAYFLFHEENPLGEVSDNAFGFIGQAGVLARLGGPVWLDIFAGYRSATVRTEGDDPLEAKLGGFSAGLGLSFKFK
jgi:Outer membrane protein beta-barrel domain